MKKNTIAVILLLASLHNTLLAQSGVGGNDPKSYVGDINQMFPSAPTSNNLMKFEEVPVSYYTGIPDINIPLVSIPTSNPKVVMAVQLKYHPLNAKPEDKASETGLGWSLIAGGTISRTVRGGNPDEKNRTILFSSPPKTKYGIYNEIYNPTSKLIKDQTIDLNDYSFEAAMGKYDTEYDLYQYNFMGQSGRFYIIKDDNGNYKPEKLDKNNLQIIINNIAPAEITSFTIVDDKGIRYTFEGMEKSQKSITSVKIGIISGIGNPNPSMDIADYWAAFNLTNIKDQNNNLLATFNYGLNSVVKFEEPSTTIKRLAGNVQYSNTSGSTEISDGSMPGAFETQYVYNTTNTKLLTSIDVLGKGSIYLNYEKGRQDSNYMEPTELYKLKSVQSNYIGQNTQQYIDKYVLDYGYSNTNWQPENGAMKTLQKMMLVKVTKTAPNVQNQEYNLDYYVNSGILQKDKWGYYKGDNDAYRTDVLKSLTYPTKGKAVFDFGENIYSYINGTEPVTGEWIDTDNTFVSYDLNTFSSSIKEEFFTVQTPQKVKLHLDLGNLIYSNWHFYIYKKNADNTYSPSLADFGLSWQSCISNSGAQCMNQNLGPNGEPLTEYDYETVTLQPGTYYLSLTGSKGITQVPISYYLTAYTKEHYFNSFLTKKGGGIRINNIKYFDTLTSTEPAKGLFYDYKDINDPQKSSGSLVFPEPITSFDDSYSYRNKFYNPTITYNANFKVTTDYNILPVQKTQGSDVGYKYVTVEQKDKDGNGKGKTVHTFRSPIDYPNDGILSTVPPVVPIPNLDYLRGQPVSEKVYNAAGQIISETTTQYTTTEFEKNDAIKLYDNYEKNMVSELFGFSSYQALYNQLHIGVMLTNPYKGFEKFGITLPVQKEEKQYFYTNGVQNSVVKTTNTTYNQEDYPISVTQNEPGAETYISKYKYAKEKSNQYLTVKNMIGIPLETEAQKNGITVSKIESLYPVNQAEADTKTSGLAVPYQVNSTDLQNVVSTELTYDKYDEKGNLLQYTTKEGVPVCIVWGYNQTQPIAKIEGITYARLSGISPGILEIVNASNTDASAGVNNDETAFLSALNTFRSNTALSGYQITTYTYDPLVGVRSITPPSGITESYSYDSANRLEKVIDVNGKVLKEMKYNYKN
ncbi:hypothetical protein ACR1PO_22225 [Chryseobacterium sp. RRHN12]|uniref:hypothetical protein n=1 Tax=Chryseobacterium sp. RRHN12 TaxID=3437884 RepID=UPI003D9ABE4C